MTYSFGAFSVNILLDFWVPDPPPPPNKTLGGALQPSAHSGLRVSLPLLRPTAEGWGGGAVPVRRTPAELLQRLYLWRVWVAPHPLRRPHSAPFVWSVRAFVGLCRCLALGGWPLMTRRRTRHGPARQRSAAPPSAALPPPTDGAIQKAPAARGGGGGPSRPPAGYSLPLSSFHLLNAVVEDSMPICSVGGDLSRLLFNRKYARHVYQIPVAVDNLGNILWICDLMPGRML